MKNYVLGPVSGNFGTVYGPFPTYDSLLEFSKSNGLVGSHRPSPLNTPSAILQTSSN